MLIPLEVDRSVPVLVLKLGRYVIHHGALGIVRSLGRLGVPVYAIVEDRFTPVAVSRYLAGAFVWRAQTMAPESVLADMGAIGERLSRPAILVPTDDVAAAFAAEHQDILAKWFLLPRLPRELPRRLSNKKDMHFLCRSAGVPCPETAFPSSLDDVHAFIERATFPVVVKAAESHRLPKGARSTSIAGTPRELIAIYREAESPASPNLMFQEYIPQSCAEDWVFHGYCNPHTDCMVAFTGKKLRSWPPFAGLTTLGISVGNEALILQTERLLRGIAYAGIMDLDYRLDKRDGQYKLLDFNPRIGANFRMFEDRGGVDVVRALHLDLTGRSVRRLPVDEDRTFIVEPYDLFASLGYLRRGGLTLRGWWNSLKGKKEIAWLSWDDPVPFPAMCVRLLIRAVGGAVRRRWTVLKRQAGQHGRFGAAELGPGTQLQGPQTRTIDLVKPEPSQAPPGSAPGLETSNQRQTTTHCSRQQISARTK
jgi:D-aspartate ligase